jgi:pyruvate-formate lyase
MSTTVADEKVLDEYLEKKEYWWWAEKARPPRIDYLRKAVWSKAHKGSGFVPGMKVCTHGVKKFTEVFKRPEARVEPYIMTWARALVETWDTIPIFVVDQARLVGYVGSAPHKIFWVVLPSHSINEDLYNDRSDWLDAENRPEIKDCLDFMKPYTLQARAERHLTRRERIMTAMSLTFTGAAYADGHSYPTPQYDYFLKGFNYIISQLDKQIADAEKVLHDEVPNHDKQHPLIDKVDNWKAMKIALEGALRWARRHARLCKIVAENFEIDQQRKQELLRMADICNKVPAEPPEDFWEAMQFDNFRSMMQKFEWADGAWPARPDYWYYPYWKKSVDEDKTMTRQDAVELVAELQIRAFEYGKFMNRQYREMMQGDPGPYVWVLGGVKPEDGTDACNDLTDAFLEAARWTRVVSPTYAFRYHRNVREKTLRQVFECIRHGLGYPNIRNDDVLIDALMYWNQGRMKIEEARTWVAQACIVPCGTTKRSVMPLRYSASTTLGSKALELVLYNGFDPISRMQIGPKTGDPTKMTFEQIFDAFIQQFKQFHWDGARIRNITRSIEMTMGRPFLSGTWEECVETGLNAFQRKEYGNNWLSTFIWMDALDALAALKKLVFEDKKYTMEQVIEMLKVNWENHEEARMYFVKAPKWGNDDDYVDEIVVKAFQRTRDEICWPCRAWNDSPVPTAPQNIAAYSVAGVKLGALPNGRRLGDTCYDGGCSPGAGLDKKGPTAVLRSVSKLDHRTMFRACLLNQRLNPTQMAGEKGFELWKSYIKTWHDMGLNHVQFNCVDNETLFAAQKEPEKYGELIVRIAGYSAHFVDMNKKTQDTIIARTVQTL